MSDIPSPVNPDSTIKVLASSLAVAQRFSPGLPPILSKVISTRKLMFHSSSSAPSINAEIVKLEKCPEIFDMTPREAKFSIRATDLKCWESSNPSAGQEPSNTDPKTVQHWALVVYFPRGEIINVFEAGSDDGKLQAGRRQFGKEGIEIFDEADYIGEAVTSPHQLLKIAERVKTGEYRALGNNNCQTWLKEFLNRINIDCGSSLSLPDKYLYGLNN